MTRWTLLGWIMFASMTAAEFAQAAELAAQQNAAPATAGVPAWLNWTGFYVGVQVGGGWGTTEWNNFNFVGPSMRSRPLGSVNTNDVLRGGQIGANWQSGRFVFGVEADASAVDLEGNVPCIEAGCSTTAVKTNTGRFGSTGDHTLIYQKGGTAGR
jgi:outer membrane immunogenic protein